MQRLGRLAAIAGRLAGLVGLVTGGSAGEAVFALAGVVLVVEAPVAIADNMRRQPVVTGSTVSGALCIYLLIGLLYANVYGLLAATGGSGLFAGFGDGRAVDRVYFSYVTLTTVGYGDLGPAGDLPRIVAITEALLGQLYLVTVVALIVGNIGHKRSSKPPAAGDGDPPQESDAGIRLHGHTADADGG